MTKIVLCAALCLVAASAEAKPKPAKKSAPAPAPVAAPHPMPNPARPASPPLAPKSASTPREVVRQESKIEFDERMVQGQRASGAIYLFNRGESDFHSLVQVPDSFIQRTIKTILPEGPTK